MNRRDVLKGLAALSLPAALAAKVGGATPKKWLCDWIYTGKPCGVPGCRCTLRWDGMGAKIEPILVYGTGKGTARLVKGPLPPPHRFVKLPAELCERLMIPFQPCTATPIG